MQPLLKGRVAAVDDVLCTGSSIAAVLRLLALVDTKPIVIGAAMLQGVGWRDRTGICPVEGAFVGPRGSFPGRAAQVVDRPSLAAVPGFGEVHKNIESSHITPEYEAALVIPHGNTRTCEASHKFSNVVLDHTLDFWLAPRRAGSPLKIFPLPSSAVPPTAWEHGAHLDGGIKPGFCMKA